jgi:protein-S-isoprenylcysteine O-methyltransferase Ste14
MSNQADIIQGRWDLVALNVAVFTAFAIPLAAGFRWRVNWQSASLGVYAAFVVSLFVEMYGVPLTMYVTSAAVPSGAGLSATAGQTVLFEFEFLGQPMILTFWKTVGAVLIILGAILIAWGWAVLYRTDEELVTSGIYAYSRHPQYLGFLLFLFGWFVHWPSLLTVLMFPVLAYFYYRLSLVEEQEVMETIDDEDAYRQYIEETPRFI